MTNYSQYDEDEYRLPEGMTRTGYDADTQVYFYRDAQGKVYQGAPGSQYGFLRPVTNEPQYPTAASYLAAHKEHYDSFGSPRSPMTEFPDTWDPPSKNTLSKLITTPVRSLQRRFSQASTLTPTERQDGQAEGLDAPSPTSPTSPASNTPVQPPKRALTLGRRLTRRKKPARLRAQSTREYIMNGRDEKLDPPAFLRKGKEDGN